ncbi:MAG: hypothetical protein IT422_17200 [Pirellulaceae bacterium]|nr:hypothetical protein [Pirellulaceae bacterium]
MSTLQKSRRISELITAARSFRFCGPSDDPDEQTAVCVGYRHLVVQLQRLASPILPNAERDRLNSINVEVDNINSVYEANAELESLLADIESGLANANADVFNIGSAAQIVQTGLISRLESATTQQFNTDFLVRLCKEINSSFAHGNIVSTALTMRAVLNYVPPVFGHKTFDQVTANSSRSLKPTLELLQEGLRKIADFHTHRTISKCDLYPSAAQVELYKPQFELLLLEVLSHLAPQSLLAEEPPKSPYYAGPH